MISTAILTTVSLVDFRNDGSHDNLKFESIEMICAPRGFELYTPNAPRRQIPPGSPTVLLPLKSLKYFDLRQIYIHINMYIYFYLCTHMDTYIYILICIYIYI